MPIYEFEMPEVQSAGRKLSENERQASGQVPPMWRSPEERLQSAPAIQFKGLGLVRNRLRGGRTERRVRKPRRRPPPPLPAIRSRTMVTKTTDKADKKTKDSSPAKENFRKSFRIQSPQ